MGEQGTEAIHADVNKPYRIYGCMTNKVERHLERALPECVNALRPQVRTRKRKQKD